ncbi:hypothetical protein FH972_026052 [Carpinus fangiana]|uniref:RRM domain-containing protein n=1 Tax=Carpinus fangiana TaxID=176857 RepID=A0A5N6L2T4_9ROSI|nr:hypothetical protein FH972_026052 [Carpinus fangiana]
MLRQFLQSLRLSGAAYSPLTARRLFEAQARPLWLPTRPPTWRLQSTRFAASQGQAGDNKTGHIEAGPNEGILFVDNIYPLKLQWLLRLTYSGEEYIERVANPNATGVDPTGLVASALPDKGVAITEIIPRLKDGGAFVKFTHPADMSVTAIEELVREYLKQKRPRPWWNPFQRVHAHLVRGRPWVEDLFRPPSCRLKIEFVPEQSNTDAAELSQEELYRIFRPYGKLREITPQGSDDKTLPKFALLDFAATKRAIMARNCLHGMTVKEELGDKALARLKISYQRQRKSGWIRDWLLNHPRIVIPIMVLLISGITVAIFDPMRTFFIKMHINQTFHLTNNRFFKWLTSRTRDLMTLGNGSRQRKDELGMGALLEDRKNDIEQIQTWLLESVDNFIVIQGPRGSGKKELVMKHALANRRIKLVVDCKPIQESRSDSATINSMAAQVGYKPVFSWMNSISGLVDLAAQGATGMKAGFSETLDAQLDKILNNTANALKDLGLDGRRKDDKDASLGEAEYLEAHPEKRPVVVIDNFLHKSQDSPVVYDKLAEWAARVTTSNIAHVIFLTTDISFTKSLGKALPDRAFRSLSLGDFRPEVAKRFVISHLDADEDDITIDGEKAKPISPSQRRNDLGELDQCLSQLGGRLTDLEFLARRVKAGETPGRAVKEIVEQSASEILKMYLLGGAREGGAYTPEQAWTLIKGLAGSENGSHADDGLRYNEILLSDAFSSAKDPDGVLSALEQAELVSIVSSNGRPVAIKPGRPVFRAAFHLLAEDRVLRSRLDLAILQSAIKSESATIDKMEKELALLAELPKQPAEVLGRVKWLLSKIQTSQGAIEKAEAEAKTVKNVLMTEY